MMYSDGYKAEISMKLEVAGEVSGVVYPTGALGDVSYNGMCFGVNPTVKGVYCFWFWGEATDDINDIGLLYLNADEWDATTFNTPTAGVSLNKSNFGTSFTPTSSNYSGAMALGETLTARWY